MLVGVDGVREQRLRALSTRALHLEALCHHVERDDHGVQVVARTGDLAARAEVAADDPEDELDGLGDVRTKSLEAERGHETLLRVSAIHARAFTSSRNIWVG